MKRYLIITGIIFVAFIFAGMYIEMPNKKVIEKTIEQNTQIIYEQKIVEREVNVKGEIMTIHGIGVYNDSTGGELIDIILEVKVGTGKSFFDVTEHFFTEDIQESMQIVRDNVERQSAVNMNTKDIYVSVDLTTSYIGGTSASAYMGIALIALLEGKTMDPNVLMTGTLDELGYILPVGNVDKKVAIVDESKFTKMLVPKYNCNEATTAAIERSIDIVCVSTFSQAINEMIID